MTSASSGLPQDPMAADLDVRVLVTIGISTNSTDVATPATSAGTTNMATTAGQVDTTIHVGLNNQPMPHREDPPLAPPSEGRTHVEQPLGTTSKSGPRYYAGEIGRRIGKQPLASPM
uniref:Uncharacterized protein n=1 Tax=Cannabis sativa TaxID=3483 RepID=A0A803NIW4_CANSA